MPAFKEFFQFITVRSLLIAFSLISYSAALPVEKFPPNTIILN